MANTVNAAKIPHNKPFSLKSLDNINPLKNAVIARIAAITTGIISYEKSVTDITAEVRHIIIKNIAVQNTAVPSDFTIPFVLFFNIDIYLNNKKHLLPNV